MRRSVTVLAAATLCVWAAVAFGKSSGSAASRTGATAIGGLAAESSCLGCHGGNALNSGGSVSILGVPALFRAGRTYRLTVRVASTQNAGTPAWGFQLTAVDTATGQGVGAFSPVNASETAVVSGTSTFATRRYVNQLSAGTRDNAASPVEWLVDWTPPASGVTRVRFFAAGLAADGNGGTSGDWVYTGTAASTDTTTPTIPQTWGEVKRNYLK